MTLDAGRVLVAIQAAPGIEDDALRTVVEMTSEELLDAIRELRREQLVESTFDANGDGLLYWHPLGQGHQLAMEGAA